MTSPMKITPEFQEACERIEAGENVFITGHAGTGKSTLLTHFRETTKRNVAVLAPTGVAAINVRGETIHSFFGFKPDITVDAVKKLPPAKRADYQKIDTIIIDEVLMVRADLYRRRRPVPGAVDLNCRECRSHASIPMVIDMGTRQGTQ